MVPAPSAQPRVTYKEVSRNEPGEDQKEPEIPEDREELIRFLQQQDEKIADMKQHAKQLRARTYTDHEEWLKRVSDLEAHVLSGKLKPLQHGKDAA